MSQSDLDIRMQQAIAALNAGDVDQAALLARSLPAARRNQPRALLLSARICMARFDYQGADELLRKCLKLAPKEAPVHLCVAQTRVGQGRYREAVAAFDKVLRLQPDHPLGLLGKAEALSWQGEHDKALALLATVVERGEEMPQMAHVRAEALSRMKRFDEAIEVAEAHTESIDAPPFLKQQLWLLIGQAHEKQGRIDEAFAAYQRGNDESGAVSNADDRLRQMAAMTDIFTPDAMAAMPRSTNASPAPVFIVGMPRCGSTLVETILDAHPRAVGLGENGIVSKFAAALPEAIPSDVPFPKCALDMDQSDVDRFGRDLLGRLTAEARQAKRVIDKTLTNFELLGLIEVLLPGAKVIHCRRDALNTCFSCFTQPLPLPGHAYACDLADLGRVYRAYDVSMTHWKATCSLPWLNLQYEQLVAEPERMTRELLDFVGLDFNDRCLRFHESGRAARTLSDVQVRQPIYTSSSSRAERFAAHLGPLVAALKTGT